MTSSRRRPVVLCALALALAVTTSGCAPSVADLPVQVPTTTGTLSVTSGSTSSSGSASATTVTPARLADRSFTAVGVATAMKKLSVMGEQPVEKPAQGDGVLTLCPVGATRLPAVKTTWEVLQWKGSDSAATMTLHMEADPAAARSVVDAVVAGAASCPATVTAGGRTFAVTRQKRDDIEGMPYGRVVLRDKATGTSTFRGMLVMGNVVALVHSSAPKEADATKVGTDLISNLAAHLEKL